MNGKDWTRVGGCHTQTTGSRQDEEFASSNQRRSNSITALSAFASMMRPEVA